MISTLKIAAIILQSFEGLLIPPSYATPVKIPPRHEIEKVVCGNAHCCALVKDYGGGTVVSGTSTITPVFAGVSASSEQGSWLSARVEEQTSRASRSRQPSLPPQPGTTSTVGGGPTGFTHDVYCWGRSNVGQAGGWRKPSVCPPKRMRDVGGRAVDVWCGGDATAVWVEE